MTADRGVRLTLPLTRVAGFVVSDWHSALNRDSEIALPGDPGGPYALRGKLFGIVVDVLADRVTPATAARFPLTRSMARHLQRLLAEYRVDARGVCAARELVNLAASDAVATGAGG